MPTHFEGSTKEKLCLNVYIKLLRANASIQARVREKLLGRHMTISQLAILEAIFHLGPMKQRDLAEKLLMTGGNITKVIDNLEKAELVERKKCGDRRAFEIHLTAEGKKHIGQIFPQHVEDIVEVFDGLDNSELKTLDKLLKKLGLSAKTCET